MTATPTPAATPFPPRAQAGKAGPTRLPARLADPTRAAPAERARLARDLHDTVVQSLAGIGAQVGQVREALRVEGPGGAERELAVLQEMVAYGREEAQRTILGLRPHALAEQEFPAALAAEVARLATSSGLRHQFTVAGIPQPLSPAVEEGLLRIAQEALSNVRRHAIANSVQVRLAYDTAAGCVALTVEDDGQGFDRRNPLAGNLASTPPDPDASARPARHTDGADGDSDGYELTLSGYGLLGMQERAHLLGGTLRVASGHEAGTLVEVEVPCAGPRAGVPPPVAPRAPAAGTRRVRVVVADDHPLARAGVRRLLAADPEIEVVGEAADGGAALAEIAALRPDVLLLDLQLGEMDGVGVLERLHALPASAPVPATVVLTTYDQDSLLLSALRAGARGYVLKQAEGPELARTVRAAARGEALLPPGLTARLLTHLAASAAPPVEPLTARELDVLRLLAAGHGTKTIAARLNLQAGTVKSHLEHVYQKLHVVGQGRGAAVAAARAQGLL